MKGRSSRTRSGGGLSRDEELGKRDDDFRPKKKQLTGLQLSMPWTWRRKRLVMAVVSCILIYLFIHNIPTDLRPIDERLGILRRPGALKPALPLPPPPPPRITLPEQSYAEFDDEEEAEYTASADSEPQGAPPGFENGMRPRDNFYFDGPIRFYRLDPSLEAYPIMMPGLLSNNVLFAAASLQSVANIMPLACELGKYNRSKVHFLISGRHAVPLETLLEINGVSGQRCNIVFHDVREDYAEFSSDARAESAVSGAMRHLKERIRPRVMIMDDSILEEKYLTRAMRAKAQEFGVPLIELPDSKYESFLWMARLDTASLSNWFRPTIEILIQAPTGSSGALLRLMRSLLRADYTGLRVPKITIELPPDIEPSVEDFLENVQWPPAMEYSPLRVKTLSLHHRISSQPITAEQASVRVLESFYPADSRVNHVLILSPDCEVAPTYLHYLHYTLLEYRYGAYDYPEADALLGLALDVPRTFINGSGDFIPPTLHNMDSNVYAGLRGLDLSQPAFFRYQAPSATAALIFGDKWVTLHDFVNNRLIASHVRQDQETKKLISETQPAWLEHALELMRARGWSMLHPPLNLAVVHDELAQLPEEFKVHSAAEGEHAKEDGESKDTDHAKAHSQDVPEKTLSREFGPLHRILPIEGDLPELPHTPLYSHKGIRVSEARSELLRERYLPLFRREIGGCEEATARKRRVVNDLSTDDLFCLPDQELEFSDDGRPDHTSDIPLDEDIDNLP